MKVRRRLMFGVLRRLISEVLRRLIAEVKLGNRFYERLHDLVAPALDSVIAMFLGKSQSRPQGYFGFLVSGMVAK